ncbi:response regulator [uncultured Tateyamaria sp.]|uniref:response regulator n=1 Tax=Tateyamaria sp. 1078 TaxID=3417464 RepID=UPI00263293F7|nr:response regulator [uncultured Tateyamaria sp.]
MAQVLVLEDDAGLRFAFSEALENAGHSVLPAGDPDSAIAHLKRQVPDVLLLDLMIGNSYSTDVANYAAFAVPDAHVIYVTGSGLFPKGELFDMCRNARLILRKPVDLQELTDLVSHICPATPTAKTASA